MLLSKDPFGLNGFWSWLAASRRPSMPAKQSKQWNERNSLFPWRTARLIKSSTTRLFFTCRNSPLGYDFRILPVSFHLRTGESGVAASTVIAVERINSDFYESRVHLVGSNVADYPSSRVAFNILTDKAIHCRKFVIVFPISFRLHLQLLSQFV